MRIAYELKIDEELVIKWHPDKFARWVAFFKHLDKQDQERAKGLFGGKSRPRKPRSR